MLSVSVLRCWRAHSKDQLILRPKVAHAIIIGIFLLSGISELFQRMTMEGYRYLFTIPFVLITAMSAIIAYVTAFILHKVPNEENIPIWIKHRSSIVGNVIVLALFWLPNGILQILYHSMKYDWVFVPQHSIQLIFSVSYIFVQRDVFRFGLPSVCVERKASHTTLCNNDPISHRPFPGRDGPMPFELLLGNHFVRPLTTSSTRPSDSAPSIAAHRTSQQGSGLGSAVQVNSFLHDSMYSRSTETMREELRVWPFDRSWPLLAYNVLEIKKISLHSPKVDV